jgi:pimeloyl-ACP methyl ester carboxylesterase
MEERWVSIPAALLERGEESHDVHAAHWRAEDAGEGVTVVAVHGLGGSHLNWSLLAPLLVELDGVTEVWAPDLAGFGLTEPGSRTTTVGANVDLATAFIRTVSPERPIVLIGNSMGGLIGIKIASRHPDLLAGLVLVDPAAPPRILGPLDPQVLLRFSAFVVPGVGERWMRRMWSRTTPEEQVAQTMALVAASPDALDAQTLEHHVAIAARRRDMPHAISAFIVAARSVVRHLVIGRRRYWAAVDAISTPTLLVHGAADRLIQDHVTEALVEHRPDWGFRSYPDLGHVPMLEDPARVSADIAEWLAEVGLAEVASR